MELYDYNWFNNEDDIMESLVEIAALPNESNATNTDVLNYLLQPNQQVKETSTPVKNTDLPFSIIENKDNFVTFIPSSAPVPSVPVAKKTKFKEPIFVAAAPQKFGKNKKQTMSSQSNSSGDDISDDDMVNISSDLKQMTSKERRQHRNKISARNFRVRRKEFITQLQDKVKEQDQIIENLKKENQELRKSNNELMNQLLNQPSPPPSSNDEPLTNSSSSSSEGNNTPEAPPAMFQFQLDDLYDFNLFDNEPQAPSLPPFNMDASNFFYINNFVVPDVDITHVLSEKVKNITLEEEEPNQISNDLFKEYPLMAAALMSIILRHTMSLDYVAKVAEDLRQKNIIDDELATLAGEEIDDFKHNITKLIQDAKKDQKEEEESENEFLMDMLKKHKTFYAVQRAFGRSHEDILAAGKRCRLHKAQKRQKKQEKEKIKQEKKNNSNNIQALELYCRVAGELLRHPQRMPHVKQILKQNMQFNVSHPKVNITNSSQNTIKQC